MYILCMRKITIFISLLVFWSCDNDKGDKTAPEVTIISPESGSIVNEVVSITSEATDNNKIEFVQFFVTFLFWLQFVFAVVFTVFFNVLFTVILQFVLTIVTPFSIFEVYVLYVF